jgi:hypothetical protein
MTAGLARHEIKRFSYGHHDAKIKVHSAALALETWNGLQDVRNVRLRSLVKLHIGMDGKSIATLQAHAFPFTVGLHAAAIDAESVGLANRTSHCAEARFNLLYRHTAHPV